MNICEAEIRLAKEIALSWKGNRSNHIVVAPPMSRPRTLFNQLVDKNFLEEMLQDVARKICVAKLDTNHFKSEISFVDAALNGWGMSGNSQLKGLEAVEKLETGVGLLVNRGSKPILMVHRFHEALTKLGEDIGTALRNLEHDLGLMTVVELPVSLGVLRERWDLLDNAKAPFLASDWGQGHSSKVLKGYSRDEISKIGLINGVNDRDVLEFIFDATSGLPELVHLIIEDSASNKITAVKAKVQRRSLACCKRLMDWLDKPGENLYKRLFSHSITGSSSGKNSSIFSIQDHDWKDFFSETHNIQRPLMLAWACVDSLIDTDDVLFDNYIGSLFRNGNYVEFLEISKQANPSIKAYEQRWTGLKLLAKFGRFSDPFNPDWEELAIVITEIEDYLSNESSEEGYINLSPLLKWRDLIGLMLRYISAKKNNSSLRLEEFICTGSVKDTDLSSFIQILQLRLDRALKMDDYLSVKSIIEQPESLLQVYSYIRHELRFWDCNKLDEGLADRVSISIRKPFNLPKKGNPLGFVELLYLNFQISTDNGEVDSFAPDFAKIEIVDKLYGIRKDQVHSTSFISSLDTRSYHDWCKEWLEKLEDQIGFGKTPKLMEVQELSKQFFLNCNL